MENLSLDLEELKNFYNQSSRPNVKDSLLIQIKKLETAISNFKDQQQSIDRIKNGDSSTPIASKQQLRNLQIKTYAYDQSDRFFTILITEDMHGIGNHPDDQISAAFTESSVKVSIAGFNGTNRELCINHLCGSIVPSESSVKKKRDSLVVSLRKAASGHWPHVSKRSEKPDIKTPKIDKDKDPNESLMDMMKQMYEDGDDDMKRTIAKAWSESRNKSNPL